MKRSVMAVAEVSAGEVSGRFREDPKGKGDYFAPLRKEIRCSLIGLSVP